MRVIFLGLVSVFPFILGLGFTASLMPLRYPMPTKRLGGRGSYVVAAIMRASTWAVLALAVAAALHQAASVSTGVSAALTAIPFAAGAIAAPFIARGIGRGREGRA